MKHYSIPGQVRSQPKEIWVPEDLEKDTLVQLVKEAIIAANKETKQGSVGDYEKSLDAALSAHGIFPKEIPPSLGMDCAWDNDCFDILGDMASGGEETSIVLIDNVSQVLEHQDDDFFECNLFEGDGEFKISPDEVKQINISQITLKYPRADRYGVPECATEDGALAYLADLGFRVNPRIEVFTEDNGDDSCITVEIKAQVPTRLLMPVNHEASEPASPAP